MEQADRRAIASGGIGSVAAVDWGSSARRLYLIDAGGRVVRTREDEAGTLTIARAAFPAEVERLRAEAGDVPLLMAGMVGSNRGWIEAPYVPCPATLADIAAALLWAEPRRTAIVPGVSMIEGDRADVMRGEEVQVFGALALGRVREGAPICHPGTHTKWIEVAHGAILRFRTTMTGELFALLRRHSILSDLLAAPVTPGPAFRRGVETGFASGNAGAELFAVRAGVLLGARDAADASSYTSGLLIGCDLRAGLAGRTAGEEIVVLGRGTLTALYAAAIDHCGFRAREQDGAEAFVAGMHAIAEILG